MLEEEFDKLSLHMFESVFLSSIGGWCFVNFALPNLPQKPIVRLKQAESETEQEHVYDTFNANSEPQWQWQLYENLLALRGRD